MKRFWDKVNKLDKNKCWEWESCKNSQGYGAFRINGKTLLAHRVAWTLTNGDIPEGLFCLHHCDNPPCCNPSHLFLGTNADNMKDMARKGRARNGDKRGTKNGQSKIDEIDVVFIKYWLKCGYSQSRIAESFDIGQTQISNIKIGKNWSHLEQT